MQCSGLTRSRDRCTNKAKYKVTICKAEFDVCKKHQNKRLLSMWEKELYRRIISGDASHSRPPQCVQDWINCFHDGWQNTQNIYVSANYATSLYNQGVSNSINFNRKFKVYVDDILGKDAERDICGVCMKDTIISYTECGHKYCKPCMTKWLRLSTSCPHCRKIL